MSCSHFLIPVALLFTVTALSAQEGVAGSSWRGLIGGGMGIHLHCGECKAETVGLGVSLGLQRALWPSVSVGVTWTGAWVDAEFARLNRHVVHLDVLLSGRSAHSPFFRVGVGPTVSTRVTVDGPPDPPEVGDVVVGIGDTMGYGGVVGAGFRRALSSSLTLVPELRFSAQRVEGATLAMAVALVSLGIG